MHISRHEVFQSLYSTLPIYVLMYVLRSVYISVGSELEPQLRCRNDVKLTVNVQIPIPTPLYYHCLHTFWYAIPTSFYISIYS